MRQISHRDALHLLLILALAAVMRFGRSDIVEYFHDDAMLATLALQTADGTRWPLTGILSSTGIPNSPVSVYLLTIPFAIKADPRFAIHFVMLLNVIGVGLLWFLARMLASVRVAGVVGFVYAINPWAALFSRKLWAQELHTPLILLGFILLLYGLWHRRAPRRARSLAQALALPILLFALQFHFAAWSLLPAILLALWLGRRRLILRAAVMAALLSILVLLPYAAGLAETLDHDPSRVSDAVGRSTVGSFAFSAAPLGDLAMLAAGVGLETWLAPAQAELLASRYPPLTSINFIFNYVLAFAAAVGCLACFKRAPKRAMFIALWAFAPALMLSTGWTPSYVHYQIPSIPALALLTGFGFEWLLQRLAAKPIAKWLAWAAFVLILTLQFWQWHSALSYVAEAHVAYPGFTTPLGNLMPLRERLRHADDVLVISQGMAWNLHHEVAVWDTLLWDDVTCARVIKPQGYAVFPAHAFTALVAPDAPLEPRDSLYAQPDYERYPTRLGDRGYYVFDWGGAPDWTGPSINSIDARLFSNGVQLTGYALHAGEVYLEWRLPGRRAGMDYQYSAQIYAETGERLGQWDGRFWHGRHWCAGDRLLTWGSFGLGAIDAIDSTEAKDATNATNVNEANEAVNALARTLKVAMYTLGSGKNSGQYFNADVLDTMGNPVGQAADIALPDKG